MSGKNIFQGQLTIGLDLGDRSSAYCVLNEAGEIVLEHKLATTSEAMKQVFGSMPRCRIAMETGTHSPWVSRLLNKSSKTPIKDDELVVAVTRDGKIYLGRYMQKSKIRNYIEKLILWIGKADAFFFMRLLRLPYLMDLMRGNRKNNRKTTRH
jgi:hypothetical protein